MVVYGLRGERIRQLRSAVESAGVRSVHWDGRDERGAAVPTGVYFYRVSTARGTATGKIH